MDDKQNKLFHQLYGALWLFSCFEQSTPYPYPLIEPGTRTLDKSYSNACFYYHYDKLIIVVNILTYLPLFYYRLKQMLTYDTVYLVHIQYNYETKGDLVRSMTVLLRPI